MTLTSSASSGNLWSDNETTASIVVTTAGTYTVSDTQGGCPSPLSAPATVSLISVVQPQIAASQPIICPGTNVILDATTAGATAYLWNTASATTPTITVTNPGFYEVTVTVNGCQGTDTITIATKPQLGMLMLQDTFAICDGEVVTLDATTSNAVSYSWSSAGITTP